MTDVLLINPPLARYDYAELAPPLSLLTLAANIRSSGRDCRILDLNLPEHRAFGDSVKGFYSHVREAVANAAPREVGITSMGVNSHVALEIAIDAARSVDRVAVGGVHISSISDGITDLLPSNVIIAPPMRRANGTAWWNSTVGALSCSQLLADFDIEPYFTANPRHVGNLEVGVGCKYRCAFCYSPTTYSSWSNAAIDHVVNEFMLMERIGFAHLFLVGDNLTNDPVWFAEVNRALVAARTTLTWNGYATLPDLSEGLVESAAAAGCTNLYLGIDAVSPEQQQRWRKGFSKNTGRLRNLLAAARNTSMQITCAFVLDVRPEVDIDTVASLDLAGELRALGADIRLAVLTEYPETALFNLEQRLQYSEMRPSILMDLPAVVIENRFAPEHPSIFPWHTRPLAEPSWTNRLLAVHAAQTLLQSSLDLPDTGEDLWRTCLKIAQEISCVPTIHKVELKHFVRNIYQTVAA